MIERLRNWLLITFFQDHLDSCIETATRQGSIDAFKKAHADIMETMRDDLDKKAEELAQEKLAKLLSPIDPRMIVTIDKRAGAVFIGGEKATPQQLANLQSEAEALEKSDLWKILSESPKALAHRAMFIEGDNLDTLKKGRSMLYTLSTQQTIIDTFRSYSQVRKT